MKNTTFDMLSYTRLREQKPATKRERKSTLLKPRKRFCVHGEDESRTHDLPD